ncbi:hypothetical protein P171DRAFT_436048 [Karstenula rhodostoma CBS 690.94]|uniref:Zn(2)-C6 fungal-type domain-containing protein n=1 Tax=Karstenula rhodostoma CBS 690.94 TaxID=1392251 RepID=A0A9P4P8Q4_9PLEO|nr:hypothetical protein P171DRAFT_436048 [Karstenula rhodostoma CBS 690.94]
MPTHTPMSPPASMLDCARIQKKATRSIACERCHSRRQKCSGGHPCSRCSETSPPAECVYPSRDRKVKLSQQYVDDLLRENELLRSNTRESIASTPETRRPTSPPSTVEQNLEIQETTQNPLIEERPWFHPVSAQESPIHVGEAADTAFSTRFRQTVATVCTTHLPRTSFIKDEPLTLLAETDRQWPTPARARFLVKVALNTICRYYHIVLKTVVLESLEEAIKLDGKCERLKIAKLLALFALGEAYSARSADQGSTFPGLIYFVQSRRMVSIPAERPQVDSVEIALLLTLYSFILNRRHSAYVLASSAVRNCLVMGMQLNVPEHQYRNRRAREHRTRLWWSAYVLDRACASKLGLPTSIADDDIYVDGPSGEGIDDADEDFDDVDYSLRSIEISRIAAQCTREIYGRRKFHCPFSQRVQSVLKEFTKWMDSLPSKFHLKNDGSSSLQRHHIVYLHLRLNQGVILATRPILLHALRVHQQSRKDPPTNPIPILSDSASTLAETCAQCARHSYRIITDAWIHGTFTTFDYFNTQYLFSAATILAVSSLLPTPQSSSDGENFDNAVELLKQLAQSGSFGAKEFCEHIDAMKQSMAAARNEVPQSTLGTTAEIQQSSMNAFAGTCMTAGMALAEPSFQGFLAETNLDMQALDNPSFYGLQTPYWPEIWGDGWVTPTNV